MKSGSAYGIGRVNAWAASCPSTATVVELIAETGEEAGLAFEAEKRGGGVRRRRRLAALTGVAVYMLLHAPSSTEPAIADGETRTLNFVNNHTNETGEFTFLVNGAYDPAVLEKLNWFMRDWRLNEQTKMDPHLFDILWEVYRGSGSAQPIDVLSAYRSPQTNGMLRRRSRLVAERSQHIEGKAIDAHFIDIGPGRIRDVAMRMQEGGVGFYPIGSTPWVHIDSGTIRYWPRMNRNALARLFPDGKTVFIPSDGQPMDQYAEAKAMIEARGGDVQTASSSGGVLSWLFGGARGGGADDDEEAGAAPALSGRGAPMIAAGGRGGSVSANMAAASATENQSPPPPSVEPASISTPQEGATTTPVADQPLTLAVTDQVDVEAPTPPRKPTALLLELGLDAPVPPRRPPEFAILTPDGKAAQTPDDLIATLIERKALPGVFAKGLHEAPKSALALTGPDGQRGEGDPTALAHAAALTLPPMPPPRPRLQNDGVTKVERSVPRPVVRRPNTSQPSAANPFGSLVVDAFQTPSSSANATSEMRSATP